MCVGVCVGANHSIQRFKRFIVLNRKVFQPCQKPSTYSSERPVDLEIVQN